MASPSKRHEQNWKRHEAVLRVVGVGRDCGFRGETVKLCGRGGWWVCQKARRAGVERLASGGYTRARAEASRVSVPALNA